MGPFHGNASIVSGLENHNRETSYLTTKSPGVFGTHLIDFGKIKG